MSIRSLILATLLATAGAASAQALPQPAEFYFDEDASATRPVVAIDADGDAVIAQLLKAIERDPRAHAEIAQLAHLAMAGGRPELGRELYTRVIGRLDLHDRLYRPVLWNYGWDLYRSGDHAGALAAWRTLLLSRKITAQWMPQTLALALWSLDRRDEAVQWYAAAVRSEPQRWRGTERFESLLPDWRPAERATLAEVQAAWAQRAPGG